MLTDTEIESLIRLKYKDLPEGKYDYDKSPNGLSKQGKILFEIEEMKALRDGKNKVANLMKNDDLARIFLNSTLKA